MPKIDVIINPADKQPVEHPGKVFNGWKCPRTGQVFRFKSAYLKHLKQYARSERARKKQEAGEVDGNSILVETVVNPLPDKHRRNANCRARDFLNLAYGFNNWTSEAFSILSDYILTVAISRNLKKHNKQ